jgi:hypothetical protein
MDNTTQQDLSPEERIEYKREIIRQSLNETIIEIGDRLRQVGLHSPIFLTVPLSGDAIVTIATPLDPSDEDWSHVGEIVRTTVSERLGGLNLQGREMICAMANSPMVAADLTTD